METLECIKTRRSFRQYSSKKIEQEKLDKIIEAGLYAASGMNTQNPIIVQITEEETLKRLSHLNAEVVGMPGDRDPFYGAPAVLVVLYNKENRTGIYDGSLVMGNMMLAAHELGLGSCWIHRAKESFETEEGKEILKKAGVTGDYEGVGNLIVGYPEGEPRSNGERKPGRVYYIK